MPPDPNHPSGDKPINLPSHVKALSTTNDVTFKQQPYAVDEDSYAQRLERMCGEDDD